MVLTWSALMNKLSLEHLNHEKENSVNHNQDIKVNHAYQHNVYVKQMDFDNANMTYCGHHHEYDHVTMVASGRVKVTFGAVPFAGIPEEVKEYSAVSMFVTRSFRLHTIESLEPNTTVCCIHALRTQDGEILEPDVPKDHYYDPDYKTNRKPDNTKNLAFNAFGDAAMLSNIVNEAQRRGVLEAGTQDNLME